MLDYPAKLILGRHNTPLVPIDNFCQKIGLPRIWFKRDDLTSTVASGNKLRKLEFIFAEAQHQGCDTLITCGGIQSNHCRAVALLGKQQGFNVHLILRGTAPKILQGNFLIDWLCGATINIYDEQDYRNNLDKIILAHYRHYQHNGRKVMCIPTGGSNASGVWGYVSVMEELQQNFIEQGIKPTHVFTATGSGGTQAGLIAGNELLDSGLAVFGVNVCDDADYFHKKIIQDLTAWQKNYQQPIDLDKLNINIVEGYVEPGYGIANFSVWQMIRELATTEGILLDPVYTGKAFYGMVSELKNGSFSGIEDIIFIHTGGLFGLLAQSEQLACHFKDEFHWQVD